MAGDRRTSAEPKIVGGVTFHCYRVNIGKYQWRSEDGRASVIRRHMKSTYLAKVDGIPIMGAGERSKRFLSQETALEAVAKAISS